MYKKMSLAVLTGLLAVSAAHAGDKDLVKYRHNLMEVIGGHMNSAAAIVKGEVPYKADLAFHADGIAAAAPKVLTSFKTKAMSKKSDALPEIWDKWAEFEKASKKFETASADFSKAAKSGEMAAVGAALGELGKSCKGCHDDFMEEH
jgi:cytochrome c556